jgi:hypothetical protein
VDKLQSVDEFFRTKAWFLQWQDGIRMTGYTLKIEPTGYLLVIKAISPEGPLVGFYGCETLEKLYRFLQNGTEGEGVRFRPDKFALAHFEKKE